MLTFIIPVRHPSGVADWATAKQHLAETLASLHNQTSDAYEIYVVANRGTDLPPLGAKARLVEVDTDPMRLPAEKTGGGYLTLVRYDKGWRVMAGLVAARPQGHVMVVDYDDLVSRKLAAYVDRYPKRAGWFIRSGWLFEDDGRICPLGRGFNAYCGTSLIFRARWLKIPKRLEDADSGYVMAMFGSHRAAITRFADMGRPLQPLPFAGAAYRLGHANATSRTGGIEAWLDKYFANRQRRQAAMRAHIEQVTPLFAEAFGIPTLLAPEARASA